MIEGVARARGGRRSIVLRCRRRGFPGGGWCDEAVTGVMASWHGALGAGIGIVGGLCSALFGAGAGPIYVVYFDILGLEKAVFRATMSAVVLLGGAARIVGYGSLGLYGHSTIALLAVGLPLMIVGSWLGDRLVYR